MKIGEIIVKGNNDVVDVEWTSPVAYMSFVFMGKHIENIRYSVLPRRVPGQYVRVVNHEWRGWWLYWALDFLAMIVRIPAKDVRVEKPKDKEKK